MNSLNLFPHPQPLSLQVGEGRHDSSSPNPILRENGLGDEGKHKVFAPDGMLPSKTF